MHSPATLAYFCAPAGHLWEWEDSDGNQGMVWSGSQALVVFRQELVDLLEACVPVGLPPMGSILLVAAAASESYDPAATRVRLWEAAERATCLSQRAAAERTTGGNDVPPAIASLWAKVGVGLDQIHALPADLRSSGPARRRLLRTLFEEVDINLPRNITPVISLSILSEFVQTPFLNVFQQRSPELNGVARLLRDLSILEKAFTRCPPEHLEERLRTGIDRPLSRAPELPLPEPDETPLPEPPADLLRAMEHEGGELAHIAGLVRRIGAMLHVPKAVTQREELPLGGVSDITNRGDPSRLLMTELAWDDLTFAVRLAQGEALYLRRESPPAEPPPRRLILIDTGIFMWGKPRLFALASALALQRQKVGAQTAIASLFTLEAAGFTPVTLDTVPEVRAQLARLQPHPHPGAALASLADSGLSPFQPNEEVFLITHAAALETLCHLPVWRHLATSVPLHTLLVDREGHLELSRHSLAGARLIAHARIDAEDLFEPRAAGRTSKPSPAALISEAGRLPQFYRQKIWPLCHPAPPANGRTYQLAKGLIGVSKAGCVCWWSRYYPLVGRLLLPWQPADELCYAGLDKTDPDTAFLAFRSPGAALVELAVISLKQGEVLGVYTVEIGRSDIFFPCFNSGYLVVHLDTCSNAYSCLEEATKIGTVARLVVRGWPVFDGSKFHENGSFEDLPCTPLELSKNLLPQDSPRRYITDIQGVALDSLGRVMILTEGNHIYMLDVNANGFNWVGWNKARPHFQPFNEVSAPGWQDRNLRIALFPDGRRIVADPRGYLHVCDSGEEAHEISIMLVKGHTVAWTPNGKKFGESNLLGGDWPASMSEVLPLVRKLFRAPAPDKAPPMLLMVDPKTTAATF
ncbi:hypothetical protein [Prosthecobacter sp.]|uniref:hypothetical protein n=1 Tax=Prosthecobacter sp. TaxID=1965333 RepID=UPI0037839263